VGSRAGLDGFEEEQISFSYRHSNSDRPARSQATSYSTLYDPRTPQNKPHDRHFRSEQTEPIVWFRISVEVQHSSYFVVTNYRLYTGCFRRNSKYFVRR